MSQLPDSLVSFGPDANCTLTLCPIEWSVYEYRPSLPANAAFLAIFGLTMMVHIVFGVRWREWGFMSCMILGCIDEMIGYGGRIILYQNPFSFTGFLMQIICITTAPVFYCAAIYVLLARIVESLGRQYSRLPPRSIYWIFIPCDIISLTLQAAGGALSSLSTGTSVTANDIALAGLSFQVITLVVFMALCVDYGIRYRRSRSVGSTGVAFKSFALFLALAVLTILIRCCYRIDELSQGYFGPLIHNEGLFIAFEGCMIVMAVIFLIFSHPGPVFQATKETNGLEMSGVPR